ncbi:MAG: 30S ribosome-binding factor RbfA [Phenylobacterium sp.]|nr:MAG: 30S ribosome-binding factor RbfA [Phenylobacterium sp.]
MSRHARQDHGPAQGPSQRQLRAGELVRHALVAILREADVTDPALVGVSVTVTEVRMSPDLRHATVFVEPLGGGHAPEVVDGLNRHAKFLRGRLGRSIELKFTPDLKFLHDESFNEAARMNRLFDDPKVQNDLVRRDLEAEEPSDSWKEED